MDLERIYKEYLNESHEAALQAIFNAGLAHAAAAFVDQVAAPAPGPDSVPPTTEV